MQPQVLTYILLGFAAAGIIAGAVSLALFIITGTFRARRFDEKLLALFQGMTNPVVIWRTDLSAIVLNAAAEGMFGLVTLDSGESGKKLLYSMFGFDDDTDGGKISPAALVVRALSKTARETAVEIVTADGARMFSWHSVTDGSAKSRPYIISIGTDLTQLHSLEDLLESQEEAVRDTLDSFYAVMESADIGLLSLSRREDAWVVSMPRGMREAFGFAGTEKIPLPALGSRVVESGYSEYISKMSAITAGVQSSVSLETDMYMAENNAVRRYMMKLCSVRDEDDDVQHIAGVLIDIEYQRNQQAARGAATVNADAYTGLVNQDGFVGAAAALGNMPHPAVLAVRSRKLTKVESLYGKGAASALLGCYAGGLSRVVNGRGVVGRMNDDTFGVLIDANGQAAVEAFANELYDAIKSCCREVARTDELDRYADFDAGACFCDSIGDVPTFYSRASIMLYLSGDIGRRRVHFYGERAERDFYERERQAQDISRAISGGEFVLVYQPKVSFKNGEVFGAEALICWNHVRRGLLMPGEFLPAAEKNGLLARLDRWSLAEVCRSTRQWQLADYKPLRVSVNVSAQLLYQEDFAVAVQRALAESNLEPGWLELEVTETTLSQDRAGAVAALKKARDKGVVISLDNFGAESVSFEGFAPPPIDILKIDRSLVNDVETSDEARAKITRIAETGQKYGLAVLCEGVETEEQLELLRGLGCDEARGYYVGKPVSRADMEKRFLNKR